MKKYLSILLTLVIISVSCKSQTIQTGIYKGNGGGQLNIVVKNEHSKENVQGFFQKYSSNGLFSTIFFFVGQVESNKSIMPISIFYPNYTDSLKGTLIIFNEEKLLLNVRVNEIPVGYPQFQLGIGKGIPLSDSSDTFRLTDSKQWIGLSYVKDKKNFLYQAPDRNDWCDAYVVPYDCIAIIDSLEGWIKGEYIGKRNFRTAWFKKSSLNIIK